MPRIIDTRPGSHTLGLLIDSASTGTPPPVSPTPSTSRVLVNNQPPAGSEILTNPSQIPNYNIQGQVGKTGAPGSYLYGTKRDLAPAPSAPAPTQDLSPAAPTGVNTGSRDLGGTPTPTPTAPTPDTSGNIDANTLIKMYLASANNSNADLETRRNAIMQARYGSENGQTNNYMKGLSPSQQDEIRNAGNRGLDALLSGADLAIKARDEKQQKALTAAEKIYNIQLEQQKLALTQNPQAKQSLDTVFNLLQTYPDAGILPTDNISTASAKAANSSSFQAKNTSLRAIADPINGGISYYDTKGNFIYNSGKGTNVATPGPVTPKSPFPNAPANKTPSSITTGIKPAGSNIKPTSSFPASIVSTGELYWNTGNDSVVTAGQRPGVNNYIAAKIAETGQAFFPGKDRDKVNAFNAANVALSQIEGLAKDIFSNSTASIKAALLQKIPGLSQQSQSTDLGGKVASYIAKSNAYLASIARASGEKGVLTEQDVTRAKAALPNLYFDNLSTANTKLKDVRGLFTGTVQSSIKNFTSNTVSTSNTNSGQTASGLKYTIVK